MSWFEAKGLNWAKSALKEAVASIDKALDIQDDNVGGEKISQVQTALRTSSAGGAVRKQKLPGGANRERSDSQNVVATPNIAVKSTTVSAPTTPTAPMVSSTWGSFTGSFFENPNAQETITAPPRTKAGSVGMLPTAAVMEDTTSMTDFADSNNQSTQRPSITSTTTSDSVELLSPPVSSSSDLQSPVSEPKSSASNEASSSVETISGTATLENETINKELCISVSGSLPDSIVIISEKDEYDIEEDSISYKTVVGDLQDTAETTESHNVLTATHYPNTIEQPVSTTSCSPSQKMIISLEDTRSDSHHADSDSTQSFEDVQMQTSCAVSQYLETAQAVSPASDDQNDAMNSKTNSSPHNSNDEMETTTSSDIEIISNPNGNGDSSSTNSLTRISPLKWKKLMSSQGVGQSTTMTCSKKGHFRGPSEISILSEDSQSELDRLMQRISELSDTLEARELRLLQLERQNLELQQRNAEMENTLETFKTSGSTDTTEGYTQRLSALEKKFQASIRERDALRIQIKDLKDELQLKIPKERLTESNIMIEELRSEGEKLSKEVLQQSNIIKKLRAKEKTSDVTLKKNKEEIASLSDELERMKKTLNAKEEVERSQIEAVHKMSSEKRRLEDENAQQRSKLEDLQSKLSTLQASFEAAKLELQQRTRQHTDLTRTAEEATAAKKERESLKAENLEIRNQLSELREKLRGTEQTTTKREQQLREENRELMRRLEATEMRAEAAAQEASLTTVPLMRQLESLQNTLTQRTSNWNQEEKLLLDKLAASQSKLKSLENVELKYEERVELLQKHCTELEDTLSQALLQEEKAKMGLQQAQLEYNMKESSLKSQQAELTKQIEQCTSKVEALERENKVLEEKLRAKAEEKLPSFVGAGELPQIGTETKRIVPLSAATLAPHELARQHSLEQTQRSQSPAMSFERNSQEETMEGGSIDWQAEDIDCISNSGRQIGNLGYGINMSFLGHNTSTLEHLQSMLKQRDGELVHIQWELARLQEGRSVLAEEIAMLTTELEAAKEKLLSYETLDQSYEELQRNYDALLQMYGEKVERTEELELDLKEAREAYKAQIDELLAQPSRPTT